MTNALLMRECLLEVTLVITTICEILIAAIPRMDKGVALHDANVYSKIAEVDFSYGTSLMVWPVFRCTACLQSRPSYKCLSLPSFVRTPFTSFRFLFPLDQLLLILGSRMVRGKAVA